MCYVKFLSPAATDHHSVEQREATTRSEQMASHARPPHCDRRQEEGESQGHSQLTLTPVLTFEWQQDCRSLRVFMHLSRSFSSTSVTLFLWSFSLMSIFLYLSSCPCTVHLTCSPIRVAFTFINATHSQHLCLSVSFSVSFFSPHKTQYIVIYSSQSLSMIYCNMIISHSFSQSLKSQARQRIAYSIITKIYYCISLSDHQSVSTSRCHRDRSSTESGRGYSTTDQWGVCTHVSNKYTADMHSYKGEIILRK